MPAAVKKRQTNKRDLAAVADPPESRRERDGEQEPEEDLGTGECHAELVQELDQLAVGPLLLGLRLHWLGSARQGGLKTVPTAG